MLLNTRLEAKLGLIIEPAHVRLIPNVEDGYTWAPLPEKEYLFRKQLSKHSTGAYMELCRGVGASFEAVTESVSTEETKEKAGKVRISKFTLTVC